MSLPSNVSCIETSVKTFQPSISSPTAAIACSYANAMLSDRANIIYER